MSHLAPHALRSPIASLAILTLVLVVSCRNSTAPPAGQTHDPPLVTPASCDVPPLGTVTAYLADDATSAQIEGTVAAWVPPGDAGDGRLTIRDAQGHDHVLRYGGPGDTPPIVPGRSYTFWLEHHGRFPAATGLMIWDERGLLFAAASDLGPGQEMLTRNPEGFEIELLPTTCASRPHGDCYTAIRNRPLRVAHHGKGVTLFHGDSGLLGVYRVTCLTAQEAELSESCADAGAIAVSYVIVRVP